MSFLNPRAHQGWRGHAKGTLDRIPPTLVFLVLQEKPEIRIFFFLYMKSPYFSILGLFFSLQHLHLLLA